MIGKSNRRNFLKGSVAASVLANCSFLYSNKAEAQLVPDPQGLIDLPPGFTYTVISTSGETMSDGYKHPSYPDGMACFQEDGGSNWILMRNHELPAGSPYGPYYDTNFPPHLLSYDPNAGGGVTRLVINPTNLNVVSSNLSLVGTLKNCGGGRTPWGWITCEETVEGDHGWCFFVSKNATSVREPMRLDGFGKFNHEGCVFDVNTYISYMTEDRGDGCFYRFRPTTLGQDPLSGTLQAMRVNGVNGFDTSTQMASGTKLPVDWITVPNPSTTQDIVRYQAEGAGAAVFNRGEGIWLNWSGIYFCATEGGPLNRGQIFRYMPNQNNPDQGTLEVVAQSTDPNQMSFPDAITTSDWGALYFGEDGGDKAFLRVISPSGAILPFASYTQPVAGDFSGLCFSPDYSTLFVNMMYYGKTLAIRGPFQSFV